MALDSAPSGGRTVARRLFASATGGLRWPTRRVLVPALGLQLILYVAPAVGSIVFSVLDAGMGALTWYMLVLIAAAFVFSVLVQAASLHAVRSKAARPHVLRVLNTHSGGITDRNDELDADQFLTPRDYGSWAVWYYVLQSRMRRGQECIPRVLVSTVFISASTWYLLPSVISARSGWAVGSPQLWCLYAFSWFAVCNAQWSLTSRAPPDLCTYYTHDLWSLDDYTRVLHVLLIMAVGAVGLLVPQLAGINAVLGIILCCLPLLWIAGVLPCARATTEYLSEQCLVHVNGGTPSASSWYTFFFLVYAWATAVGAWALAQFVDGRAALILAAVASFASTSRALLAIYNPDAAPQPAFSLCALLVIVIVSAFALPDPAGTSLVLAAGAAYAVYAMMGVLGAVTLASHETWLGSVANPYHVIRQRAAKRAAQRVVSPVTSPVCPLPAKLVADDILTDTQTRAWPLSPALAAVAAAVYAVTPLALVLWFTNATLVEIYAGRAAGVIDWVLIARMLRFLWLRPLSAAIDATIVVALGQAAVQIPVGGVTWAAQTVAMRLFVVYLLRFCIAAWLETTWFVLVSVWDAGTMVQKTRGGGARLALALLWLPISLALAVPAAALSAPLVPVAGLAVFWLGFPRPRRQFPSFERDAVHQDWGSLYAAIIPPLKRALAVHPLLATVCAGDVLVVRAGQLTLLLQVASKGFDYATLLTRGLAPSGLDAAPMRSDVASLDRALASSFPLLHPAAPVASFMVNVPMVQVHPNAFKLVEQPAVYRTILAVFPQALVFQLCRSVDWQRGQLSQVLFGNTSSLVNKKLTKLPRRTLLDSLNVSDPPAQKDVDNGLAAVTRGFFELLRGFPIAQEPDLDQSREQFEQDEDATALTNHERRLLAITACFARSWAPPTGQRGSAAHVMSRYTGHGPFTPQLQTKSADVCYLVVKSWRQAVSYALTTSHAFDGSAPAEILRSAPLHDDNEGPNIINPVDPGPVYDALMAYSESWCFAATRSDIFTRQNPAHAAFRPSGFALEPSGAAVLVQQRPGSAAVARFSSASAAGFWASLVWDHLVWRTGNDAQRRGNQPSATLLRHLMNEAAVVPFGAPGWQSRETIKLLFDPLLVAAGGPQTASTRRLLRVVGVSAWRDTDDIVLPSESAAVPT